jgi:hypothetical protein
MPMLRLQGRNQQQKCSTSTSLDGIAQAPTSDPDRLDAG